jgi:hypothetical protein
MAGSMVDKQVAEQLKREVDRSPGADAASVDVDRSSYRTMRDFLTKSALSRKRRFPVAN